MTTQSTAQPTLILAAFGTSFDDARTRAYAPIEVAVRQELPHVAITWAYTSRIVRRKMEKEQGIVMPDVCQAVSAAASELVAVQPILVIPGREYEEKVINCASGVLVGSTLMHAAADVDVVADLLSKDAGTRAGELVVFVGHGTHHWADSRYAELQDAFDRLGASCLVGTIEGDLSIRHVERLALKRNASRLRVRPLMLTAGDHVRNDIAGDEDSWVTRLRESGFEVAFEDVTILDVPAITSLLTSKCAALFASLTSGTGA